MGKNISDTEISLKLQDTLKKFPESEKAGKSVEMDRFKLILSEIHEGMILSDTKDRIEWINRKACQILGVNWDQVIGKSIKAFHSDTHISSAKKFFDTMSTDKLEFIEFEAELNGRFINFRVSPLHARDRFLGILRVLRDVTDNRRAQEAVKLLAQAVNAAAEAIYIIDINKKIQYINPAFTIITGYSIKDCLGKPVSILRSDRHDEAFYQEIWNTLEKRKSWAGRISNRKKDGVVYTVYCTMSPVFGEDGEITHYVTVEKDITHELEIETQLLQNQKMEFVGRLAGGISHDFNNMLTTIMGNAQLLLEEVEENDPIRPSLNQIMKASLSATAFVRQLLAFSRRQRGETEIININSVISEMEPLLKKLAGDNIRVIINKGPGIKNLSADQGQIEQIISNLTVNARDAMPKGGKLIIKTSTFLITSETAKYFPDVSPGEYIQIVIADTGVGMDGKTVSQIFEPFYTTKEKGQGTGLGLSIVYGIIKQYGGGIKVQSQPGMGTTFSILLPVAKTEEDEKLGEESAPGMDSLKTPGGNETILVVEDDQGVRELSTRSLKKLGYRVLVAAGSDEGRQIFNAHHNEIDLIIASVVMPGSSGLKLIEDIVKDIPPENSEKAKVLYLSGYPEHLHFSGKLSRPGISFLGKPFTPEKLARKTREALDWKMPGDQRKMKI